MITKHGESPTLITSKLNNLVTAMHHRDPPLNRLPP
jgi:hypothetical protein